MSEFVNNIVPSILARKSVAIVCYVAWAVIDLTEILFAPTAGLVWLDIGLFLALSYVLVQSIIEKEYSLVVLVSGALLLVDAVVFALLILS